MSYLSVLLALSKGLRHRRDQYMHIPDPKLETRSCDHVPHALGDLILQQPHVDGTVPIF